MVVWAAVFLFVLYPLGRLLVLVFWNEGPSLDAVRGLVTDWTHRAALVNSLVLAALVGVAGTVLGFAFALLALRAGLPRWLGRVLDAVVLTPLILAGTRFPVLPTQAFLQITGLYDMRGGAALCFLLLVPALAIFVGQRRWIERRGGSYVTVTGKLGAVTRIKSLSPVAIAGLGVFCGAVAPLVLTGTAFILVVCYVFRYSLAGTRATTAVLAQIDPSLEEASASLGARRDVTFRRVVLPLVRPALLASMTVLFIRAMTAISATIFLVSLSWSLVTVRILEGITNLELGQASAFSMLVILLVYLAVAVASLAMRRLNAGSLGQAGMLLGG